MFLLVTGANGFLGSSIIQEAIRNRLKVRGTDKHPRPRIPHYEYLSADISNLNSLFSIFTNVHTVIHAAGLAHVFDKWQPSNAPFKTVNEIGTAHVAKAAAHLGVRHFVLVSSVSVYGESHKQCGEASVCYPNDPYSKSKYGGELRAIEIARDSGMALTILRLATLYGEGDPGNISRLMRAIDRGHFIWIGRGSNRKSLLHREDAACACLTIAQQPVLGVQVYNVSAPPCLMRDIVNILAHALKRNIYPVHVPASMALGFCELCVRLMPDRMKPLRAIVTKWLSEDVYDSSKFEKTFGFSTRVKLREGLVRQVAWYKRLSQGSTYLRNGLILKR